MNALKGNCAKKPFMGFNELAVGEYEVKHFKRVETQYGERIRVDLIDKFMYLPERFIFMSNDDIKELNKTPKIMIYGGKDDTNHNRLFLDFKPVEANNEAVEANNKAVDE